MWMTGLKAKLTNYSYTFTLTVNVDGPGSVDMNSDPLCDVLDQDEVASSVEGVVDAIQGDNVRVPCCLGCTGSKRKRWSAFF